MKKYERLHPEFNYWFVYSGYNRVPLTNEERYEANIRGALSSKRFTKIEILKLDYIPDPKEMIGY